MLRRSKCALTVKWSRGRVSHRQISLIESGPRPIVTAQDRIRGRMPTVLPLSAIERSHLGNPGKYALPEEMPGRVLPCSLFRPRRTSTVIQTWLPGCSIFAIMNKRSLINEITGGPSSSALGCTEGEELRSKADQADTGRDLPPPSKIASRRLTRTVPVMNLAHAAFGAGNE